MCALRKTKASGDYRMSTGSLPGLMPLPDTPAGKEKKHGFFHFFTRIKKQNKSHTSSIVSLQPLPTEDDSSGRSSIRRSSDISEMQSSPSHTSQRLPKKKAAPLPPIGRSQPETNDSTVYSFSSVRKSMLPNPYTNSSSTKQDRDSVDLCIENSYVVSDTFAGSQSSGFNDCSVDSPEDMLNGHKPKFTSGSGHRSQLSIDAMSIDSSDLLIVNEMAVSLQDLPNDCQSTTSSNTVPKKLKRKAPLPPVKPSLPASLQTLKEDSSTKSSKSSERPSNPAKRPSDFDLSSNTKSYQKSGPCIFIPPPPPDTPPPDGQVDKDALALYFGSLDDVSDIATQVHVTRRDSLSSELNRSYSSSITSENCDIEDFQIPTTRSFPDGKDSVEVLEIKTFVDELEEMTRVHAEDDSADERFAPFHANVDSINFTPDHADDETDDQLTRVLTNDDSTEHQLTRVLTDDDDTDDQVTRVLTNDDDADDQLARVHTEADPIGNSIAQVFIDSTNNHMIRAHISDDSIEDRVDSKDDSRFQHIEDNVRDERELYSNDIHNFQVPTQSDDSREDEITGVLEVDFRDDDVRIESVTKVSQIEENKTSTDHESQNILTTHCVRQQDYDDSLTSMKNHSQYDSKTVINGRYQLTCDDVTTPDQTHPSVNKGVSCDNVDEYSDEIVFDESAVEYLPFDIDSKRDNNGPANVDSRRVGSRTFDVSTRKTNSFSSVSSGEDGEVILPPPKRFSQLEAGNEMDVVSADVQNKKITENNRVCNTDEMLESTFNVEYSFECDFSHDSLQNNFSEIEKDDLCFTEQLPGDLSKKINDSREAPRLNESCVNENEEDSDLEINCPPPKRIIPPMTTKSTEHENLNDIANTENSKCDKQDANSSHSSVTMETTISFDENYARNKSEERMQRMNGELTSHVIPSKINHVVTAAAIANMLELDEFSDSDCEVVLPPPKKVNNSASKSSDETKQTSCDKQTIQTRCDDLTMRTNCDDLTMRTNCDDLTMRTSCDDLTMRTNCDEQIMQMSISDSDEEIVLPPPAPMKKISSRTKTMMLNDQAFSENKSDETREAEAIEVERMNYQPLETSMDVQRLLNGQESCSISGDHRGSSCEDLPDNRGNTAEFKSLALGKEVNKSCLEAKLSFDSSSDDEEITLPPPKPLNRKSSDDLLSRGSISNEIGSSELLVERKEEVEESGNDLFPSKVHLKDVDHETDPGLSIRMCQSDVDQGLSIGSCRSDIDPGLNEGNIVEDNDTNDTSEDFNFYFGSKEIVKEEKSSNVNLTHEIKEPRVDSSVDRIESDSSFFFSIENDTKKLDEHQSDKENATFSSHEVVRSDAKGVNDNVHSIGSKDEVCSEDKKFKSCSDDEKIEVCVQEEKTKIKSLNSVNNAWADDIPKMDIELVKDSEKTEKSGFWGQRSWVARSRETEDTPAETFRKSTLEIARQFEQLAQQSNMSIHLVGSDTKSKVNLPKPIIQSNPPKPIIQSNPPKPIIQSNPPKPIIQSNPPKPIIQSNPPKPIIQSNPPKPIIQSYPPNMQLESSTSVVTKAFLNDSDGSSHRDIQQPSNSIVKNYGNNQSNVSKVVEDQIGLNEKQSNVSKVVEDQIRLNEKQSNVSKVVEDQIRLNEKQSNVSKVVEDAKRKNEKQPDVSKVVVENTKKQKNKQSLISKVIEDPNRQNENWPVVSKVVVEIPKSQNENHHSNVAKIFEDWERQNENHPSNVSEVFEDRSSQMGSQLIVSKLTEDGGRQNLEGFGSIKMRKEEIDKWNGTRSLRSFCLPDVTLPRSRTLVNESVDHLPTFETGKPADMSKNNQLYNSAVLVLKKGSLTEKNSKPVVSITRSVPELNSKPVSQEAHPGRIFNPSSQVSSPERNLKPSFVIDLVKAKKVDDQDRKKDQRSNSINENQIQRVNVKSGRNETDSLKLTTKVSVGDHTNNNAMNSVISVNNKSDVSNGNRMKVSIVENRVPEDPSENYDVDDGEDDARLSMSLLWAKASLKSVKNKPCISVRFNSDGTTDAIPQGYTGVKRIAGRCKSSNDLPVVSVLGYGGK